MAKLPELPQKECKRCGHKWTPRTLVVVECPKCKSYNWNVDPKKQEKINGKRLKKNQKK